MSNITANGATISTATYGGVPYRVYTFRTSGNITFPANAPPLPVLIIGGGGGGGNTVVGRMGGSAGEMLYGNCAFSSGTLYTITVGDRGASTTRGGNSSIVSTDLTTTIIANGGASESATNPPSGVIKGLLGPVSKINARGSNSANSGGGGGGAGSVGANGGTNGGGGGSGFAWINGTTYAGGGGGGSTSGTQGIGGSGGGGTAFATIGGSGTANRGAGGGAIDGSGGSGVVIILTQIGSRPNIQTITPGLNSLTVTTTPSTGGYPELTDYLASIDSSTASFGNIYATSTSTTIVLNDLSNQAYTVYVRARSGTNWSTISPFDGSSATPYYRATAPIINSIFELSNKILTFPGGNTAIAFSPTLVTNKAGLCCTDYNPTGSQLFAFRVTTGSVTTIYYFRSVNGVMDAAVSSATQVSTVSAIALSPTGRLIYSITNNGCYYQNTSLSSVSTTGINFDSTTTNRTYTSLAISADNSRVVATTSTGNQILLATWNASTNNYNGFVQQYTITNVPYGIDISRDGSRIAHLDSSNIVYWSNWNGTIYQAPTQFQTTDPSGGTNCKVIFLDGTNVLMRSSGQAYKYSSWNSSTSNYDVTFTDISSTYMPFGTTTNRNFCVDNSGYVYFFNTAQAFMNKNRITVASANSAIYISFTPGTEGNPATSAYYYTIDNTNTYYIINPPYTSAALTNAPTGNHTVTLKANAVSGTNTIWDTYTSPYSYSIGQSSIIAGTVPTFANIASGLNSFTVTLNPSTGGSPDPTNYLIASDSDFVDVLANLTYPTRTGEITELLGQQYTLYSKAISGTDWSTAFDSSSATPYYKGTTTIGLSVDQGNLNSAYISLGGELGNPELSTYTYSYINNNGDTVTVDTLETNIQIGELPNAEVTVYANCRSDGVWVSDTVNASITPYYSGTTTIGLSVDQGNLNSAYISLGGVPGNPELTTYTYSYVNKYGDTVTVDTLETNIQIGELANAEVIVYANCNSDGVWVSDTVSTPVTPYYSGTITISLAPVTDSLNTLSVSLGGDAGNPELTTYTYSYVNTNGDTIIVDTLETSFQIGELPNAEVIVYANCKSDGVWTSTTENATATPYYRGTVSVTATPTATLGELELTFTTPVDGNPAPNIYRYSTDGANYTETTDTIVIVGGLNPNTEITVYSAYGGIWESEPSSITATPYYKGTVLVTATPTATLGELELTFTTPVDGNPTPNIYRYSTDGANYTETTDTIVTVGGLNPNTEITVYSAYGGIWESLPSSVIATPYYAGSNPFINSVLLNEDQQLEMSFTAADGGNPLVTGHYYSVDNGDYVSFSSAYSPVLIDAPYGSHTIHLKANAVYESTTIWETLSSNYPYNLYPVTITVGSTPNIASITPGLNSLTVTLNPSTGGDPEVTEYIIAYDSAFTNVAANLFPSPELTVTLSELYNTTPYTIYAKAISGTDWTTDVDSSSSTPYYKGTTTVGLSPDSGNLNTLYVSLGGDAGNPALTTYTYSYVDKNGDTITADTSETNFQISDLFNGEVTVYANCRSGDIWISDTVNATATPYYSGTITINVMPNQDPNVLNSLLVSIGGTDGNPASMYMYNVDGGDYAEIPSNSFTLDQLENREYHISAYSKSADDVWRSDTVYANATPYYAGTVTIDASANPDRLNSLNVHLGGTDGNPPMTMYMYSIDSTDEKTYYETVADFTLNELNNTDYGIYAYSKSDRWTSDVQGVTATPNYKGTVTIGVTPLLHSLLVSFGIESDGNPPLDTYVYTVSIGDEVVTTGNTAETELSLDGLTNVPYTISVYGKSGEVWTSDPVSTTETPYYEGTTTISLSPDLGNLNTLYVSLGGSAGNPPVASYTYSYLDKNGDTIMGSTSSTNFQIFNLPDGEVTVTASSTDANGVWTSSDATDTATPYYKGSLTIDAYPTPDTVKSLTISFGGIPGNPPLTGYNFTIDGNTVRVNDSTVVVGVEDGKEYTISATSFSEYYDTTIIWTSDEVNTTVTPYYSGTVEVVANPVESDLGALELTFNTQITGNPAPDTYWYSINGGSYTSSSTPSVTIYDLPNNNTISAYSAYGTLWSSDPYNTEGYPYYKGTTAITLQPDSGNLNTLYVSLGGSEGNPPLTTYTYSYTDNGETVIADTTDTHFQITGLSDSSVTVYANCRSDNIWVSDTVNATETPYYKGTIEVSAEIPIDNALNSLTLTFTTPVEGNPIPDIYYYSVDGGATFGNTTLTNITVSELTNQECSIVAYSSRMGIWESEWSSSVSITPYYKAAQPTVLSVYTENQIVYLSFLPGSFDGNPATTNYYYAIDGCSNYFDLNSLVSPVELQNAPYGMHTLTLKAASVSGSTVIWDVSSAEPFGYDIRADTIGSDPSIQIVTSQLHSVIIQFTQSDMGYPNPDAYYYTISGGIYNGETAYLADFDSASAGSITVTGLDSPIYYEFAVFVHNRAGNTNPSAPAQGIPYIESLTKPTITAITPGIKQLTIDFNLLTDDYYPTDIRYYIKTANNNSFTTSDYLSTTSYIVDNLDISSPYTVELFADAYDGSTKIWSVSDVSYATPYLIGTIPSITGITPGLNVLTVSYSPSENGYPDPTEYLYSLNDGEFVPVLNAVENTFDINDLSLGTYTIRMKSQSTLDGIVLWESDPSDPFEGSPYIQGEAPIITDLIPGIYSLQVIFIPSLNDSPNETGYEYSFDDVSYYPVENWDGNTFTLDNLHNPSYTVYLRAYSDNIWTSPAGYLTGYPILIGSAPSNMTITSELNSIQVSFSPSTDGQPELTGYEYSYTGVDEDYVPVTNLINGSSFILENLSNQSYTVYLRAVSDSDGERKWKSDPVSEIGHPHIIATVPPSIISVEPGLHTLYVTFDPATDGYPEIYNYEYSLDGEPYKPTTPAGNMITIGDLFDPREYSIKLRATNTAGTSPESDPGYGTPYVAPTVAPIITSIDSSFQALIVNFTGTSGSFPESPTTYYYSTNGGTNYTDASQLTSPIIIQLTTVGTCQVVIKSAYVESDTVIWESESNMVSADPYIAPTNAPTITVDSSLNKLIVHYTATTGSYPLTPSAYLYSLDNSSYTSMSSSPYVINVNTAGPHTVEVKSSYSLPDGTLVWESPIATYNNAYAYIQGSKPTITKTTPEIGNLIVRFTPSSGGYPSLTNYQWAFTNADATFNDLSNGSIIDGNTFVLSNLQNQSYTVYLRAVNKLNGTYRWTSLVSNGNLTRPYIIGSVPIITKVQPGAYSLTVTFTPSTGGNPSQPEYQYASADIDANYKPVPSLTNGNTFTLGSLTNQIYNIYLRAIGASEGTTIWKTAANVASERPYILGSIPTNLSVTPVARGLRVAFTDSSGGYPTPYIWYSVSGGIYNGTVFGNSGLTSSPIIVNDLSAGVPYRIRLKAENEGGSLGPSVYSQPGVPFSGDVSLRITNVSGIRRGLNVKYTLSNGEGFTSPVYEYSVNNGPYINANITTPGEITINNLTAVGTSYSIQLRVISPVNPTVYYYSDVSDGIPYIPWDPPVLGNVTRGVESLIIEYASITTQSGFPSITSYEYSVDGGAYQPINGINETFIVSELTEAREYEVRFRSVNLAGSSDTYSDASGSPYVGGTAPNVEKLSVTNTSIELAITGGTGADPEITVYEYSLDNGPYVEAQLIDGKLLIQNLSLGTTYTIRVRGRNIQGAYSAYAEIDVKTTGEINTGFIMHSTWYKKPRVPGPQPKFIKLQSSTNDNTETQIMKWVRLSKHL